MFFGGHGVDIQFHTSIPRRTTCDKMLFTSALTNFHEGQKSWDKNVSYPKQIARRRLQSILTVRLCRLYWWIYKVVKEFRRKGQPFWHDTEMCQAHCVQALYDNRAVARGRMTRIPNRPTPVT